MAKREIVDTYDQRRAKRLRAKRSQQMAAVKRLIGGARNSDHTSTPALANFTFFSLASVREPVADGARAQLLRQAFDTTIDLLDDGEELVIVAKRRRGRPPGSGRFVDDQQVAPEVLRRVAAGESPSKKAAIEALYEEGRITANSKEAAVARVRPRVAAYEARSARE